VIVPWKRWQCWFRGHDYIVERVQVAPTSDPNMADEDVGPDTVDPLGPKGTK